MLMTKLRRGVYNGDSFNIHVLVAEPLFCWLLKWDWVTQLVTSNHGHLIPLQCNDCISDCVHSLWKEMRSGVK